MKGQRLDKAKCRDCQINPIDYRTSVTGKPIQHGYCKLCFERRAARGGPTYHRLNGASRTYEMEEDQRETKYGVDH